MEGRDVGSVTNLRYHLVLTTKYRRPGARLASRAHTAAAGAPRALVVEALGEYSAGVTCALFCVCLLWRAHPHSCYHSVLLNMTDNANKGEFRCGDYEGSAGA